MNRLNFNLFATSRYTQHSLSFCSSKTKIIILFILIILIDMKHLLDKIHNRIYFECITQRCNIGRQELYLIYSKFICIFLYYTQEVLLFKFVSTNKQLANDVRNKLQTKISSPKTKKVQK